MQQNNQKRTYTVYPGKYVCKKCKENVKAARLYHDTKDLTWMCINKHISVVSLYVGRGY
jgi:hypothetical protein